MAPAQETRQAPARTFDVPADVAEKALKVFSAQSGREVIFASSTVGKVRTNAVKGSFAPQDALNLLLAGTGLIAEQNAKTGALMVARDPNVQRVALEKSSDHPDQSKVEDGRLVLEKVEVTGSRIRSLLGEQSIQPVLTLTRQQIERMGVSSLGDIFRYIPQVSSFSVGQLVQTTNRFGSEPAGLTSTRVSATLRGSPAGGTLLLVNGRRVPKTGQESGADAYDLSGIPISAIERIDVLLDGASAVYGADAMGGVINVILKKRYNGTEIHLNYENTFERDSALMTATVTHAFSHGRLSGSLTLSREEANAMMWRDRWFLRSMDRRPFGGSDLRFGYGGRGALIAVSGNLPGLSTDIVGIPAGSNGVNVTVQDYANAPLPPLFDGGETSAYSTPYERRNVVADVEYAFKPWLRPFLEYRWGASELESVGSAPIGASELVIPAGAPGNPFGVPVILEKFFSDVPVPIRGNRAENIAVTAGLRGDLPFGWRYESSASLARSRPDLFVGPGNFLQDSLVAAAFASGQRPVLLHDSTTGHAPNPPGTIEALVLPSSEGAERSETWTYNIQADGPTFNLPAGELRMAVGAEYREDYADFPLQSPTSTLARARNRYSTGYFAELSVPILSAAQDIPFVNRLELRAAARHDRYTDFSGDTNPSVGLLYRPWSWLVFRGSYSEGYKVPTLSQLYAGSSNGSVSLPPSGSPNFLDPLRNYQPITGVGNRLAFVRSGNPQLHPERSESLTAGFLADVPFVKGLSFSASYFEIEYLDRAGALSLTDRILLFPETVNRGARLPSDPAGWPGPVTSYRDVSVNIAFERISGWDVAAKYNVVTTFGEISLNLAASRVNEREVRSAPHLPPTIQSTADNLPMQASGSVFWNKGPYDVGVLFSHRDEFRLLTTVTAHTPAATRWDFQVSYDLSQARWLNRERWWGRALDETRLRVTIFNVADDMPPFYPGTALPDNTILDSRLRRYAVSLTKKF